MFFKSMINLSFLNWKTTSILLKWKTTYFLFKWKKNNGRQPQKNIKKWKTSSRKNGRQTQFLLKNYRQPQKKWKTTSKKMKIKDNRICL
jgi:hypothetical protein